MSLQGSLILVYGPPKIGKTQLAASFPGPVVFYATEPGHKFLDDEVKANLVRCMSEDGFETFLKHVSDKLFKTKAKTVVIDTIDNLFDQAKIYSCAKRGIKHPSDAPHGKGWDDLKTDFLRGLNRLAEECEKLGATLIFLSHSKTEAIKTRTSEYTRITNTLTEAARKIVLNIPDYILYMGYEGSGEDTLTNTGGKRVLYFEQTEVIEGGNRNPKTKAERVVVPKKAKLRFKAIEDAINGVDTTKEVSNG